MAVKVANDLLTCFPHAINSVPIGKGCKSKTEDTSLLYNEYIVYDKDQVNLKYLIDFKFVFDGQLPW